MAALKITQIGNSVGVILPKEVLALLKQLHGEGRTIILITHDLDIARHAERIVRLRDGRVESDSGPVARAPAPIGLG